MFGISRRRQVFLVAVAAALAFAMAPVVALAEGTTDGEDTELFAMEEPIEEGNCLYVIGEDGCATVVCYIGDNPEEGMVIPSELGGHAVTAIDGNAFRNASDDVFRVWLPASVRTIGDGVFQYAATVYVDFAGTYEEWEQIKKPGRWDEDGLLSYMEIYCNGPSVPVEPEGSGTVKADVTIRCLIESGVVYDSAVNTVMTATPAEGCRFVCWRARGGNYTPTANPNRYFRFDDDVVAVFERETPGGDMPPAPTAATLTFDLVGGELDGQTGTITVEAMVGDTVTLLSAPTREGYKFRCWQGSEYAAGSEYQVEGDHNFTAAWDKVEEGDSSKETDTEESGAKKSSDSGSPSDNKSTSKLPSTGDPATEVFSLAAVGAAALAAGCAAGGKRRLG